MVDIVPAEGLGRFSLRANQALPRNAYLPLRTLQQALDQSNRVNAMLLASPDGRPGPFGGQRGTTTPSDPPTLEDAGLKLKHVVATYRASADSEPQRTFEYFNLTSDRMLIPDAMEQALRNRLSGFHVQSALTYLANSIENVDQTPKTSSAIPYSTVSAVESSDRLGPLIARGDLSGPLADDEVVLNHWAAEDLQTQVGEPIRLTYFEPETTHGQPREQSVVLTLKAILPLTRAGHALPPQPSARFASPPSWANDPDLTPEVAGVTDQESIDDWDPPFPFDYARIRKPTDEDYWDDYRTTPKALLSRATGERFWGSRFGNTTSLRIAIDPAVTEPVLRERVEAAIRDQLKAFGFSLLPVKQDGLQAAAGTTPFNVLFLGFQLLHHRGGPDARGAVVPPECGAARASNAGLLLAVGLSRAPSRGCF